MSFATVDIARSSLLEHGLTSCAGAQRFGDLEPLRQSSIFDESRIGGERYHLREVVRDGDVVAIIAYPERAWHYHFGLIARVLFLMNNGYRYPTFVLQRDGTMYQGPGVYDRKNPPSDAILSDLSAENHWSQWDACDKASLEQFNARQPLATQPS